MMAARHKKPGRRPFREYVVWFFCDMEKVPGFGVKFYGGLALVVLGIILGLLGIE